MDKTALAPSLSLNQLSLTEPETDEVISFFGTLAEGEKLLCTSDIEKAEPMIHVIDLENVLREDAASQPFTRDELQAGAPEAMDGYWQVPRLVE